MSAPKVTALPSTPTSGREQKRLETRERIYQAALAEFRLAGAGLAEPAPRCWPRAQIRAMKR